MDPVLPEVRYKIQNVDFGTFVEWRGKSQILLRAEKPGILRQQWYFEKVGFKTYKIKNADNPTVTLSSTDSVLTASKDDIQNSWRIAAVPGRPSFFLVNVSKGVGDEDVLLSAPRGEIVSVTRDTGISDLDQIGKPEEFRWRLIEVAPASLPDGDGQYRVRTLNGDAIHSATQGTRKVISIQNQAAGPQRAWEVKSQGNGRCTIKSIAEQSYLCAEKVGGRWTPGLSKTLGTPLKPGMPFITWRVKSISDFAYSFCIHLPLDPNEPTKETPMSLSVDQKTFPPPDKIILKPMKENSKAAHNQLWCIEAEDAPLNRDPSQVETDDNDPTLPKNFHGIEINKDYLLRYGGDSLRLYLSLDMSKNTVISGPQEDATPITVERNTKASVNKDQQGVYLSASLDGKQKWLVLKNNIVELDIAPHPWILEENPDETRNFYIYDGKQPSNVLRGQKGMVGEKITSSAGSKSDKNSFWLFEASD
ncbi:hypothetical protein Clacol_005964 [Clathrus columnatus]|uniref:Ricin B lectin domain-containing protein n=1 Tax=Clathrus columnatus TaxID=1419009 RepID=A0AAV5AFH4_9AGAM|nr:hypothetical protein Clacol_005964 [Clathrus columnatus]